MADTSGEADIRGIDINKLARGFADETLMMKRFVRQSKTKAREIRWYSKTAGFLDVPDTSGITASQIANTAHGALPFVTEPSWTRNTSYIRKYFVESPWISEEDLKDNDVDILATTVRDLVRGVSKQVDSRIYNILSGSGTGDPGSAGSVQTIAATADGWDDDDTGDPIEDIMAAKNLLISYNYDAEQAVMILHPDDHKNLLTYLINVKGSSIPQFSSEKVKTGIVMGLLGIKIAVSSSATTDFAVLCIPSVSATYKQFTGLKTAIVSDPGIGKKIRAWEEGECILTDPKSVVVITDTQV